MAFLPLISCLSDFCIETEDISSLLKKKSIFIPPTQYFTYPLFLIEWYLSTCVSEHHNPSKKKKRSPMQYHTCVLYIITSTSTRNSERGSRHDKKFLGIFRKKEKKEKRNPLFFPISAPPDTGFEIPTGA